MAITERLDRFQRKHPWAGFPLAVVYKYFDDFGAYLAALLTYYGFVSLFPLLLLLSTVLGFVLAGDQSLQHELLTSAVTARFGPEATVGEIDGAHHWLHLERSAAVAAEIDRFLASITAAAGVASVASRS